MSLSNEFLKIAEKIELHDYPNIQQLYDSSLEVGRSFSGSWIGYHANVYYENFDLPPSGSCFSQMFGLMQIHGVHATFGNWCRYESKFVIDHIYTRAGNPDTNDEKDNYRSSKITFNDTRDEALSLLFSNFLNSRGEDAYLQTLIKDIQNSKLPLEKDYLTSISPEGQLASRDQEASAKGIMVPPHYIIISEAWAILNSVAYCKELKSKIIKLAKHIENINRGPINKIQQGNKIFIGHGHSSVWRDLKDYLIDRLDLEIEEFNRVPVAGVTTIDRLKEMLNNSCFAFLIMTAEDESADGKLQARMNVIHETGLFQGRLGFEKAIILLEEGCEKFTNIDGLTYIGFKKNHFKSILDDIRNVLEKHNIV